MGEFGGYASQPMVQNGEQTKVYAVVEDVREEKVAKDLVIETS